MQTKLPIDPEIDVDLRAYAEGEQDPHCVTEIFDLDGRRLD